MAASSFHDGRFPYANSRGEETDQPTQLVVKIAVVIVYAKNTLFGKMLIGILLGYSLFHMTTYRSLKYFSCTNLRDTFCAFECLIYSLNIRFSLALPLSVRCFFPQTIIFISSQWLLLALALSVRCFFHKQSFLFPHSDFCWFTCCFFFFFFFFFFVVVVFFLFLFFCCFFCFLFFFLFFFFFFFFFVVFFFVIFNRWWYDPLRETKIQFICFTTFEPRVRISYQTNLLNLSYLGSIYYWTFQSGGSSGVCSLWSLITDVSCFVLFVALLLYLTLLCAG